MKRIIQVSLFLLGFLAIGAGNVVDHFVLVNLDIKSGLFEGFTYGGFVSMSGFFLVMMGAFVWLLFYQGVNKNG